MLFLKLVLNLDLHAAKLYEPKKSTIMRRGITYNGYYYNTGPLWIGIELRDIRGEESGFYYSSSPENFIPQNLMNEFLDKRFLDVSNLEVTKNPNGFCQEGLFDIVPGTNTHICCPKSCGICLDDSQPICQYNPHHCCKSFIISINRHCLTPTEDLCIVPANKLPYTLEDKDFQNALLPLAVQTTNPGYNKLIPSRGPNAFACESVPEEYQSCFRYGIYDKKYGKYHFGIKSPDECQIICQNLEDCARWHSQA